MKVDWTVFSHCTIAATDQSAAGALASNHCGWPVDEEGNALPSELPKGIPKDHPHQKKLDGVVIDNVRRAVD